MPISRRAISDYLKQEFQDYRWMKELDDKDVEEALADLSPSPKFRIPFRKHQKIGFLLGLANPGWYFQYQMGTGKTGLVLELFNYLFESGQITKALVCVPTNELVDGWEEELQKWGFTFPYLPLKGSTQEKWDKYNSFDKGLVLVSYPGLVWMNCSLTDMGTKNKMVPQADLVRKFTKDIDAVAYDEITKASNHQSLTFRICNQISKVADFRYGLAGRPFGRDPISAWAQFLLIDHGDTFSQSIGFFREVFFNKKKAFWGGPWAFEYKFNRERENDFGRIMANASLRYAAEDCIDLPEVVDSKQYVTLPDSTREYYNKAIEALKSAKGNYREIQNAFIRMRQISSGFLGFKDDETEEKAQIEFPDNPKLNLLLELIEQMPQDRKAIVSVDFTYSGMKISEALHKAKINHGWLYGATKDWPTMKKKFDTDPKFRVLIVQSKKGAYGLNLQSASYLFYYESPVSVLDRLQSEARVKRQGQKHTVFQYDLICKGTADESILRFHREGKNLYEAIVVNPDLALVN